MDNHNTCTHMYQLMAVHSWKLHAMCIESCCWCTHKMLSWVEGNADMYLHVHRGYDGHAHKYCLELNCYFGVNHVDTFLILKLAYFIVGLGLKIWHVHSYMGRSLTCTHLGWLGLNTYMCACQPSCNTRVYMSVFKLSSVDNPAYVHTMCIDILTWWLGM